MQLAGFAYFDIDWGNFGISNDSKKNTTVIFYDVDSSCSLSEDHSKILAGNTDFHTLYYAFREKFRGDTVEFFNVAILAELYIATVFAHTANNNSYSKILRRNTYMAKSYFDWRRGISVPSRLKLGVGKKRIVNRFLTDTVDICRDTFSERRAPKSSLAELRRYTLRTFEELSSLPLITPSPLPKSSPKPKPKPKPKSKPKPKAKLKPKASPKLNQSSIGSAILITVFVVGLSIFLRDLIIGSMASDDIKSIFTGMLLCGVAPVVYILTRRVWVVFLGQLLILLMPWAWSIDEFWSYFSKTETILRPLAISLAPSLVLWGTRTRNKRVSVWTISASALASVITAMVYDFIMWGGTYPEAGLEFVGAVIAALFLIATCKIFRRLQ
jgi:hypothetical protein